MKLIYRITLRISLALLVVFTAWAAFFYVIITDEINDETDDALESYAETIIKRALRGEELPSGNNGTNNGYFIVEISEEYAESHPRIAYFDDMVYVEERRDTEPARFLKNIFRDKDNRYYELTVSTPTFEKDDLQMTILYWMVFLYALLLATIVLINLAVFHRSMKPLYVLLDWLDGFTVGGKTPPLENRTTVTEFRKLNEAALRSARRNEETFEQQKQFIGNASHELQTPLAVCCNRLELLADDPSLTETQLGEILRTKQTLEHIVRLNKTLLLLSKIENGQFTDTAAVDLNGLTRRLLEDYTEWYGKNIRTEVREEGVFTLATDETLASVLVSNLLKNAYVHNRPGGTVRIEFRERSLTVRNTGKEEALDGTLIFRRFYQGARKEGSTGLGLALAETIARRYGLSLAYRYENGEHTFTLEKK